MLKKEKKRTADLEMSARHGGDGVGAARERVRRSTSQTLSDDSESEMSHLRSASRARVKERPSSDTTEVCLHFLHLPVPINIGPLSPNIVGCIIIQNCQLSQSDSRRRGGLVINSSNFASQDPGFLGLEALRQSMLGHYHPTLLLRY